MHNKLEKNRRAHLRECFEFLRKQLPANDDKKLSNLGILKNALRFIQVNTRTKVPASLTTSRRSLGECLKVFRARQTKP